MKECLVPIIFSTRWLQVVPWAFGIRRVTCKTLHHFLNLQSLLENSVLRIPFSLSLVLQLEKWKEQTITQILSVDLLYWLTDYHLITNSVFENGWIYSTTAHKLTTTIWGFMSRPCWRMFSSISHSIARTWSKIYTTCNHQLQVKKKSYCHLHLTCSHLWFISGSWLYGGAHCHHHLHCKYSAEILHNDLQLTVLDKGFYLATSVRHA